MKAWILSSSVLVLITILLRTLLKTRISARVQYALWLPVLLRLLLPFSVGSSPVSVQNIIPESAAVLSNFEAEHFSPKESSHQHPGNNVTEKIIAESSTTEPQYANKAEQVKITLFDGWLAVAAVLLLAVTISHFHFLRKLRLSRQRLQDAGSNLPVFIVRWIRTPFLAGVFHPSIYLPVALAEQPERLRHVVVHEEMHFRHGDQIWSCLRMAVLALHWYNPLVWIAALLSKHDAELACDEASLQILGDQERKPYGETLLSLSTPQFSSLFSMSTAMTESKRSLQERIRYIVSKPQSTRSVLVTVLVFSLFIMIATFTGRAESNTSQKPPADAVHVVPAGESPAVITPDAAEVLPGFEITVTTVDEFLAAIGPERTIILDGELFDLSAASNYGSVGSEYYYWIQTRDGPELMIHDVTDLTIHPKATFAGATTITAIPRFANVLNFSNCSYLRLVNLTLGHTEEPGTCSGSVLNLQNCDAVTIGGCRLYGCGVLGLQTSQCNIISVIDTEINDCSRGAAAFFQTDGIGFRNCNIHDVPSPALTFNECRNMTWNSSPLEDVSRMYDIKPDGSLVAYAYIDEAPDYSPTATGENTP